MIKLKRCKNCIGGFEPYRNRRYCDNCKRLLSNSTTTRRIRNREFINNYKKDKKCEICGYEKYTEILDFYHKNKEEKGIGVNILMKTLKNLDMIKEEIEKCMLICPNCHRELHLMKKYGKD